MADLVLVLEEHVQEELDKVKGMSISELKDPIKQPGVKGGEIVRVIRGLLMVLTADYILCKSTREGEDKIQAKERLSALAKRYDKAVFSKFWENVYIQYCYQLAQCDATFPFDEKLQSFFDSPYFKQTSAAFNAKKFNFAVLVNRFNLDKNAKNFSVIDHDYIQSQLTGILEEFREFKASMSKHLVDASPPSGRDWTWVLNQVLKDYYKVFLTDKKKRSKKVSIISKKAKLEAAGQEKEEDEHGICEDAPLIDDEVEVPSSFIRGSWFVFVAFGPFGEHEFGITPLELIASSVAKVTNSLNSAFFKINIFLNCFCLYSVPVAE